MDDFFKKCPVQEIAKWPKTCFQSLLSKCLSLGILAGSVIVKLPQILNILSTRDVKGLSPESFYSEVPLTILTVVYNIRKGYSFANYGESVMILIQNVILVLLLWHFSKPQPSGGFRLSILGMFGFIAFFCYSIVPDRQLNLLPLLTLPLMVYSRMAQIISSWKQRTTGQLSSITTALNFLGSLARVFTTITDVGLDISLLMGFGAGSLLSAIQLGQVRKLVFTL